MATTKTTVYLTAADYRRLKALARATDRTTAELVREAVAEYARRHAPGARPKSLGAGRSGRGDVAERAEALLRGLGRLQAEAIATLDLRHFGVVQIRGRPRLLPRDL